MCTCLLYGSVLPVLREFREFALRGNVIDLAVGVIVGAAFGKIVSSLVNDIIMPPFGLLLGEVDFSRLYVNLSREHYASLADAKAAGAITVNYGVFLNTIIEFLIISFAIFLVIRQINRWRKRMPVAPSEKECPFCASSISVKAVRCPQCTSELSS